MREKRSAALPRKTIYSLYGFKFHIFNNSNLLYIFPYNVKLFKTIKLSLALRGPSMPTSKKVVGWVRRLSAL
jgi:hypothetical protein